VFIALLPFTVAGADTILRHHKVHFEADRFTKTFKPAVKGNVPCAYDRVYTPLTAPSILDTVQKCLAVPSLGIQSGYAELLGKEGM
jgi:hypothetical protein